jgi:hypothetical protein
MPMLWSMYWLNYLGEFPNKLVGIANTDMTKIAMLLLWHASTTSRKISNSRALSTRRVCQFYLSGISWVKFHPTCSSTGPDLLVTWAHA